MEKLTSQPTRSCRKPMETRMTTVRSCALSIALLIVGVPAVGAQSKQKPEIYTSGTARVPIAPDLATIGMMFTARGKSPLEAGRAASQRANAILDALVAIGIPRDSMPTGGRWGSWGSWSQMDVKPYGRDTTYITTNNFTVRIRDLELIGRVIDTALAEGAQMVANAEFLATDTRKATLDAIKEATIAARENAETIAAAAGGKLGRLVELNTETAQQSIYRDPYNGMSMAMGMGMGEMRRRDMGMAVSGGGTSVVAPQLGVTVTVYGRWEFR